MQQIVYTLATDVLWLLGCASMPASQVSVLKHIIAHHTLVNNRTDKGSMHHDTVLLACIAEEAECGFEQPQAHSYMHSALQQ